MSDFLAHHIGHCKSGARRQHWHDLVQAHHLLRHPAILDIWISVADSLGEHADEFIQWCLAEVHGFMRLLAGDGIRVSLGGHRNNVLSALREQLGIFSILNGVGVNGR